LLRSMTTLSPEEARGQEPPHAWEASAAVGVGAILVEKVSARKTTIIDHFRPDSYYRPATDQCKNENRRILIKGEGKVNKFTWLITEAGPWLEILLSKKRQAYNSSTRWNLIEKEADWGRTLLCTDRLHEYFAPPAGAVCSGQTFKLRTYKEACLEVSHQKAHVDHFFMKSFSSADMLILWEGRVYLRYSADTNVETQWLKARVLKEGVGRKMAEEEVNKANGEPASSYCISCDCYWKDHPYYARRVVNGAPGPRLEKSVHCMFCHQKVSREEKVLVKRDPDRETRWGGKLARYRYHDSQGNHDSQGTFHLESSRGDPCASFRGRELCEFLLTLVYGPSCQKVLMHRPVAPLGNGRMLETAPPRKTSAGPLCHFTVIAHCKGNY
jgi:hypothetical protein